MTAVMPRYRKPASPFGERLVAARRARGLSQVELARRIGATQRAITYYEVEATFPPAEVVPKLAKALRVSTDELFGVKPLREKDRQEHEEQRLWRKFRQVRLLPEKDQRAIARMISSLVGAKANGNGDSDR